MNMIHNKKLMVVGLILLTLSFVSIVGGLYVAEKLTMDANEKLKSHDESLRIEIKGPSLIGNYEKRFMIQKSVENIPSF